jgi:hypothetical protein
MQTKFYKAQELTLKNERNYKKTMNFDILTREKPVV